MEFIANINLESRLNPTTIVYNYIMPWLLNMETTFTHTNQCKGGPKKFSSTHIRISFNLTSDKSSALSFYRKQNREISKFKIFTK